MNPNNQLLDAVIQLHNIARTVEMQMGNGKLSEDIRSCADRLHALMEPLKSTKEQSQ